MTNPLSSLYTDLIVEHAQRPEHAGLREPFSAEVHHTNPVCGDEITLRVHLTGNQADPVLSDLSYDATGCAMSVASASMMAGLLIGKHTDEIEPVIAHLEEVMHARGQVAADEELLGDAVALAGAAKFPARVKCVLMPWKAYQAAVLEAGFIGDAAPTDDSSSDDSRSNDDEVSA